MEIDTGSGWRPTRFRRFLKAFGSSMKPARIVTDAGEAFIKVIGNPQGPHALARELVGTSLARWFGLATLDHAVIHLTALDEIPLADGGTALPGPAFVTRAEHGHPWGGDAESLRSLSNPSDITRMVVFDTWTLNTDRCAPPGETMRPNHGNVFLSEDGAPPGSWILKPIDHDHCFTGGRDLSAGMGGIDRVRDERVFGLFEPFAAFVGKATLDACTAKLRTVGREEMAAIIATVPHEWDTPASVRGAWADLLCSRAAFLADRMEGFLEARCGRQLDLGFDQTRGGSHG